MTGRKKTTTQRPTQPQPKQPPKALAAKPSKSKTSNPPKSSSSSAQPSKKRPSNSNQVARPQKKRRPSPTLSEPRRSQSPSSDEDQHVEKTPYILTSLTTRVPHATVTDKWSSLPPSTVQTLTQLFRAVHTSIPTSLPKRARPSASEGGEQRADRDARAHAAVTSFIDSLSRKVGRIPVPPGKWDFNPASLRSKISAAEENLRAERAAVVDLDRELARAEKGLERDMTELEELRKNAKAHEARREKRGVHPVLVESEEEKALRTVHGLEGVQLDRSGTVKALRDYEMSRDRELGKLEKDLRNHLGSMVGNLRQVEGVGEGLRGARAKVGGLLHEMGRSAEVERAEGV